MNHLSTPGCGHRRLDGSISLNRHAADEREREVREIRWRVAGLTNESLGGNGVDRALFIATVHGKACTARRTHNLSVHSESVTVSLWGRESHSGIRLFYYQGFVHESRWNSISWEAFCPEFHNQCWRFLFFERIARHLPHTAASSLILLVWKRILS